MIINVSLVSIPVRDKDKAIAFYTKKLGFELQVDVPCDGERWVELIIPGCPIQIALYTYHGQEDRIGTRSNICFGCRDAYTTYTDLTAKGVEFLEKPTKQSWGGVTAIFKDPDGNQFCLYSESKEEE